MRKILLVLLLVIVVFANENNHIPQIIKSSGKIYSAVLIPNCKGFYTYKDGKVTKWQLNPIQPVESFVLHKNIISFHGLRENIFVTKDAKRLIYKSKDLLQLWDLKSKKLLKELKPKSSFWLATYSDYGLVLLNYDSQLQLLDDRTLKVLKQTRIPRDKEYGKVADFRYYPINMIVGKDILHINYATEAYYLNLKTLKTIDFSNTNYEDKIWVENTKNQNRKSILRDLKNNTTTQFRINPHRIKYFEKYKDKFNPIIWDAFMKYIWTTRFYSTLSSCQMSSSSYIALYRVLDPALYTLVYTRTTLQNGTKTYNYKIWQNGDFWYVEDDNHFFNASEGIKEYLYFTTDKEDYKKNNDAIFTHYKQNYKKILKIKE